MMPTTHTLRHRRRDQRQVAIPAALARPPVHLEVIVPVYNEALRLPETLGATVELLHARRWDAAVVVVDNDSVDGTDDVVSGFTDAPVPVRLIGCSEHGKGAAVRRGLVTSSARYVGFIDADNATPIDTLGRALTLLEQGHSAVIASRRAQGAHYVVEQPVTRRLGSSAFNALTRLTLPDIADSQCGFKFFAGDAVREVVPECHINGFAFDVEILAALIEHGHDVVELPVDWTDVPGSTFSIRRHGLRSVADLVRISLTRR